MSDFFALKEDGARVMLEDGLGYVLLETEGASAFWTDVPRETDGIWTDVPRATE